MISKIPMGKCGDNLIASWFISHIGICTVFQLNKCNVLYVIIDKYNIVK